MARSTAADSANSQFYFNISNNASIFDSNNSDGYAVFGMVVSGTSTLTDIGNVPVGSNGSGETSQPTGTPPTILWAYRIK